MGENGPAANDGGVKPRARLLVLAVDAGDKDLIMQWAREGVLPTFRSLLDTSAVAHTSNPVGFVVGSVWPSFWTGLQPDDHGRYCYTQFRTGTYDHYDVTPTETRGEPFWRRSARTGVGLPSSTFRKPTPRNI